MGNKIIDLADSVVSARDLRTSIQPLLDKAPEGTVLTNVRMVPGLLSGGGGEMEYKIEWYFLALYQPPTKGAQEERCCQMMLLRSGCVGGPFLPKPVTRSQAVNIFAGIGTAGRFHFICSELAEKE